MSFITRLACALACVLPLATGALADNGDGAREVSAQRRPSVTIYPRRNVPGPNATRHCDAWLAKEYRISGTVVVPRMRCYWR